MMRRLLLFLLIPHLVLGSCPSWFEPVRDGECRGNYTRISTYSDQAAKEAITKCQEITAKPIIIRNADDQAYWQRQISPTGYTVIGIVCDPKEKKWVWADNSPVFYRPPSHPESLDGDCTSFYNGMSWMMKADGTWTYYAANHSAWTTDIFCTSQLEPPLAEGCGEFVDAGSGNCYQIGMTAQNWRDAQMICAKLGANLVSIHSGGENSYVRRLATSRGAVNGLMLGATLNVEDEPKFEWIDGSEWNYDNFYPGFPMNGIDGACVAMDTTTSVGQWMNIDCSSKLPVACEREKGVIPPTPTCEIGALKEGTLILSPGFPFDASVPCDFFLTVEKGKTVEVEILFLEANSCCDFLTLHDDFLGGTMFANLTGRVQETTYTSTSHMVRASWKPNGGVNVRGLAMTFRGVRMASGNG